MNYIGQFNFYLTNTITVIGNSRTTKASGTSWKFYRATWFISWNAHTLLWSAAARQQWQAKATTAAKEAPALSRTFEPFLTRPCPSGTSPIGNKSSFIASKSPTNKREIEVWHHPRASRMIWPASATVQESFFRQDSIQLVTALTLSRRVSTRIGSICGWYCRVSWGGY